MPPPRPSLLHRILPYLRTPRNPPSSSSSSNPTHPTPHPPVIRTTPLGQAVATLLLLAAFHLTSTHLVSVRPTYGVSMLPTIASAGDWVLISKRHRRGRGLAVGDVVSFATPFDPAKRAVKRVVGMPGDFVVRDTPGVHALLPPPAGAEAELSPAAATKMIQVPPGHIWVTGDNLAHSRDSRHFGPVPMGLVKGKVIARVGQGWRWWSGWTWFKNGLEEWEGW